MFSKYHWLIFSFALWLNFGQYTWAVEQVVEPIQTFLDTGNTASHTELVTSIAFSSDNQFLLSGSKDGTIKLWNVTTGQEVRTYQQQSTPITLVEFSPNGQQILVGTSNKQWVIFDFNTGSIMQTLTEVSTNTLTGYNPHERIAFAPDGLSLFIANKGTTEQWSLESGVLMRTYDNTAFPIDISADGQFLVSVNQNYYTPVDHSQATQVQVTDIANNQVVQTFTITEATDNPPKTGTIISSLKFSPDGQKILQVASRSSGNDATKLWDRNTGQASVVYLDRIADFAHFSADGTWALFGNFNAPMDVVELVTGNVAQVFGNNTNVSNVIAALSADSQKAASFEQNTLILWDVLTGNKTFVFEDSSNTDAPLARFDLSVLELSSNGKWLGFADKYDNAISLLDAYTGQIIKTFEGHSKEVQLLSFTPDNQRLISVSEDNILKQWEIETGLEVQNFSSQATITNIAVAPNSQQLLLVKDGFLELQDLANSLLWSQTLSDETINAITFSPDGSQILTAGNKLILRDTVTGNVVKNFPIENEINLVSFLPNGQSFISADNTGLILWDMASGQPLRQLGSLGVIDRVSSISIAPNNQWIVVGINASGNHFIPAIASSDFSIQLLNIETGELVRTFKGVSSSGVTLKAGFDFVRFSPLGNFVYTTSFGYFDEHFEGINKWYSGLGAVAEPENNTCSDQVCKYKLSINEAGFYVAEVTLPTGETEGQWGLSINNSSGSNPSGFSAGSVLRRDGEAPGFISFYLTAPTAVNLEVVEYLNKLTELSVTVKKDNTDIVYGPVTMPVGTTNQTTVLEAGYYVVTISSLVGGERSYVGVGVYGNNIQSNVDVGGMIDESTGLGFIGFLVTEPMDVQFNLLYGGNYNRLGASDLKLEILRSLDDTQQSTWSSDSQ
ncbi:hypothetical protein [Candidatus Albibeggiatoa sp. nov. BB20]|uniref:WD40 repeat domain-containing protein n=1 Tax=Candidatus Albibeggiatoa sp. nov. BB20 TaxID=3162723 RepID=UPI00336597B4